MKEYVQPEVEIIDFASEEIATGAVDGVTGTGSYNGTNPLG